MLDLVSFVRCAIATTAGRKGVTAAEYAVLASAIVLVVATAAGLLATRISNVFGSLLPTPPV